VNHVVSKIGTADVPTDPMAIEDADIMILLKEREEWTSANSREELIAKMKDALADVPNVSFEFTQPIQLRFNELMTGAKTDIAIKIFGEDVVELKHQADHAATIIREVQGAGDVKVEQTAGPAPAHRPHEPPADGHVRHQCGGREHCYPGGLRGRGGQVRCMRTSGGSTSCCAMRPPTAKAST
jgi:hypothetical protein